jgi:hypothetical protein
MTDMSKKTEALKLAEDALKRVRTQDMELVQLSMIALAAIREAQASEAKEQPAPVAKPRKQEPVAWLDPWTRNNVTTDYDAYGKHGIPLYTSPQAQRTWVGLTDEDHAEVKDVMIHVGVGAGVAWIENKLREKNGITKEQT